MTHPEPECVAATTVERRFQRVIQCRALLHGVIFAMVRDFGAVEDLLQDAMLEIFRSKREFDLDEEFRRWSAGVARNVVLRHWAKQARAPLPVEEEALVELAGVVAEEEADIWERERLRLRLCLERLPERSRRLLHLRYEENLTGLRLAAAAGVPEGSLRTTLLRLRAGLRRCLQRQGITGGAAA